jgi:head-tail adaptor
MLTDQDLAGMRETVEQALPEVCTIERKQVVSDGQGGETVEWLPHLEDLPCRKDIGTGREELVAGRLVAIQPVRFVLPAGTDVTDEDRIVHAERVWEILAVDDMSWELARVATSEDVT